MFNGLHAPARQSSMFRTKISLSLHAEPIWPGLMRSASAPPADAWNTTFLPSGAQLEEPARLTSIVWSAPSASMTHRSEVLTRSPATRSRLLSNVGFFASGEGAEV